MLFKGKAESPENPQLNSVGNYIRYYIVSLMERIRTTPGAKKLKAVILGCTHYPFYTEMFDAKLKELRSYQEDGAYLYQPLMADRIELVNPALNVAQELYEHLKQSCLFNPEGRGQSEFYVSIPNSHNRHVQMETLRDFTHDYRYGRESGEIQEYVKRVPFSRQSLPPKVINRLAEKVPAVFELIQQFNQDNAKTKFLSENEKIR